MTASPIHQLRWQHSRRPSLFQYALATLVVACLGLIPDIAGASNGGLMLIPGFKNGLPTYSKQSGLRISVDSTGAGNRGYRPVKVTLHSPKPTTADMQLTVKLTARSWNYRQQAISVEQDFEFIQGTTSATSTFSVPQYNDWNYIDWDVWVDGAKDKKLCVQYMGFNTANGSNSLAVGTLTLDANSTAFTNFMSEISGYTIEEHRLQHFDLSEHWLDYSTLDILLTTAEDLQLVQTDSPEKFDQLLRWVRSGGNLWVLKNGQDYPKLVELNKIIDPSAPSETAAKSSDNPTLPVWRPLSLKDNFNRLKDLVALTMDLAEQQQPLIKAEDRDAVDPDRAVDSRQWFVARGFGFGMVVAFEYDLANIGGMGAAFTRSSLYENLNWVTRHGNDPGSGNADFNKLLIPDVGTAPVFEFQLLITLFVIVIGPVNYWILKRRNQLPLMLVTVPLAALLATTLLFSYGLLAGGVGTRLRARTMTFLDQHAAESASWARLSYYAGIAPGDGLQFPRDTTVYPVLPAGSEYNGFGSQYVYQDRTLEWDKQQQLKRGWLASRTPTQYLAITARSSKKKLTFDQADQQLAVTNQLGTKVLALVVQDHQGKFYQCDAISPGDSAKLTSVAHLKAVMKLRSLSLENLPELPAGYVDNRRNLNDYGISVEEGLLENQFEAMISPLAKGWGNGTYIAVTATGIENPLGLEGVKESRSFHVVRGAW